MKKLKSLVCILFCLIAVGVFSACGKKEVPKTQNPNENKSDELTLSEVLNKVYENFNTLTTTDHEDNDSLSSKNGTIYNYPIYDNFVYSGIYMLKLISEADGIETDVWLQGEESELDIEDGNPSKLDMLYISRKKQNSLNLIEIYMVFHKKSVDFADFEGTPQAYLLYNYNISFDEKSNEMSIDCNIENSSSRYVTNGSTAICSNFYYSTENDGFFKATTFERIADFGENLNLFEQLINEETIKNFDCIVFNFKDNTKIYPGEISDLNVNRETPKTNILTLLKSFYQIEPQIFNLDADKKVVSGLTDKFIAVAGASHISDFIK